MPFRSKKQRTWMQINRPDLYSKWKKEHGTKVQPKRKARKKRKGSR